MHLIINSDLYGMKKVYYDEEDADLVSIYDWYIMLAGHTFYAFTVLYTKERQSAGMHRIVMGLEDNKYVIDHINHDGLDNRKENLRICTSQQNSWNRSVSGRGTSKYKGVIFSSENNRNKRWKAQIKVNYKRLDLGWYWTEEEAALAYNKAALEHFGEFACLNIVDISDDFWKKVEEREACNLRETKIKSIKTYSSIYNGVTFENGKWRSTVCINNQRINLGTYTSEIHAALAYNEAIERYFKDPELKNKIDMVEDYPGILLRQERHKYNYIGVRYDKGTVRSNKVWRAVVKIDGKWKSFGRFHMEEEAALKYNEVAKHYFGDLAVLNNII